MKRFLTASLAVLLFLTIFFGIPSLQLPARAEAKHTLLENLTLVVNEESSFTLRTIHDSYANNRFISMRDMAAALSGTEKRFELSVTDSEILITNGLDYVPLGGENTPFSDEDTVYSTGSLRLNSMKQNGEPLKYHTYIGKNAEDHPDAFLSITDMAMLLDADMWFDEGKLHIDTGKSFQVNILELEESGFFLEVKAALVGDAMTGEVFEEYDADKPVPIASTTKLMTCLLVMDEIASGNLTLEDPISFTDNAARLSRTSDGVIPMNAGGSASLWELLYGMLLPSSNECALAMAEHIAGSEEIFVKRMNQKALDLGLSSGTVFYNCHGLPVFTDNITASKIQNHMTARDMFTLVCHLLNTYPQVTEITSCREMQLPSFNNRKVSNTNPLLYNMPNVIGLKTGTTNASGASLVSAAKAHDKEGKEHIIVAVEFGAEDGSARNTVSQVLLRYGCQALTNRRKSIIEEEPLSKTEALVRSLLELME